MKNKIGNNNNDDVLYSVSIHQVMHIWRMLQI